MSGFRILNAGIFATIQDRGRYGYTHLGVCHSGAMDEYAYLWGQMLLNNHTQNSIELMTGLKLQATAPIQIAITGANLSFKINGISKPIWQTHQIYNGDILSFEKQLSGQRAYLCVQDGFILEKKYGSYATTLKEGLGIKLCRGDFLACISSSSSHKYRVKNSEIPNYQKPLILRVLLSYQEAFFSPKMKEKFFDSSYEITLQSDRMGYRLQGQAITPNKTDIISEGIAFGSIQIPQDGQPIVLLKERQTIGGYPKIGTVLPIDCYKLAQANIGSKIKFEVINIAVAQKKLQDFNRYFRAYLI